VSAPLLEVRGLRVTFPLDSGARGAVVDGIDLEIERGEVLSLVGESGCGKSLSALAILRLIARPGRIEATSRIAFDGIDLLALDVPAMRRLRGARIAMIFQEPMTSLNPVQRVGNQVSEAILLHERMSAAAARARVVELFARVGIPDPRARLGAYPHQLSGGLKQRIMIAMAVAMRPALLIADEPTTALDVTVQAQILDLLRELQRELGTAILLITHDLGVVNEMADRVAVMYAGRIVERGARLDVLQSPGHPYTQGLLRAVPARAQRHERLLEIPGVVPPPETWSDACRFATRCTRAFEPCTRAAPSATTLAHAHVAWCHALGSPTS
jgi:oligopeptide/dipeptide ABC transporter ATP-binding protein